ncbi:hypothetical protein [Acidithiobacillus caldus]|uniref:hypothetical protein n=2 Tax=Acidithiobacillus caldus TaxID=33059 RepID=UPI0007D9C4AC|nr:hypothetical protein [Acidithiobacillus caldus]
MTIIHLPQRKSREALRLAIKLFNADTLPSGEMLDRVRILADECRHRDPADSAEAMGFLAVMKNDVEGMLSSFATALRHSQTPAITMQNFLSCLMAVGQISFAARKAREFLATHGEGNPGLLALALMLYMTIPDMENTTQLAEKLSASGVDMDTIDYHPEIIKDLSTFLEESGICEKDLQYAVSSYVEELANGNCRIKSMSWAEIDIKEIGYPFSFTVSVVAEENAFLNADHLAVRRLIRDKNIPTGILKNVLFSAEMVF